MTSRWSLFFLLFAFFLVFLLSQVNCYLHLIMESGCLEALICLYCFVESIKLLLGTFFLMENGGQLQCLPFQNWIWETEATIKCKNINYIFPCFNVRFALNWKEWLQHSLYPIISIIAAGKMVGGLVGLCSSARSTFYLKWKPARRYRKAKEENAEKCSLLITNMQHLAL